MISYGERGLMVACDVVHNFVFLGNRLERTLHRKVLQFSEPLVFLFINDGN